MAESFLAFLFAAVWKQSVFLCSTFASFERISSVPVIGKMLFCEGSSDINRDLLKLDGAMMEMR